MKDTRPLILRYVKSKRNGQWRFKLYGGNGELIVSGEQHPSKYNAERAFENIKQNLNIGNYEISPH